MIVIHLFYLLAGGAAALFLILFALCSLREGKARAAGLTALLLLAYLLLWLGGYILLPSSHILLSAAPSVLFIFALLFFGPWDRGRPLKVDEITEQVDERDVVFAREEYEPGTQNYYTYYELRPENKDADDKLRALPELLAPGGRYYEPARARHVGHLFRIIEDLTRRVDGEVAGHRKEADPVRITSNLKEAARRLGADDVGVTRLNRMYVYSHVGRGPEAWGAPIENRHAFALVFSLEMDYASVQAAPRLLITEETAVRYLQGALISISLAGYIRSLGWPARAHIAGSNYQVMLPPVAHDAGLGELGRMGYLISPHLGARVRLGCVTTDLPLIPDKPVSFGVQDFCEKCRKCAINCPSGAIPKGGKVRVRGVEKWPLQIEKCLHYWRTAGSDCGLCMKVCPYSHPPTLVHNVVRAGIRRSPLARTLSVWGDDLFYGKKAKWDSL